MSQAERIREKLRTVRRDFRLEKMDLNARQTAWDRLKDKVKDAFDAENNAREAMEEYSSEETRRRYLATKMHRMVLVDQSAKIWS